MSCWPPARSRACSGWTVRQSSHPLSLLPGRPAMTCMDQAMAEIELSAGAIRYEDSGGEGPVVVLCHGLLMAASLWDAVVAELGPGVRCVRPTLPLGAHRQPMRPEADLSLRGQVRLLAEFLERLELEEVTLVFNDWCGAQLLVAEGWDGRVGAVGPGLL